MKNDKRIWRRKNKVKAQKTKENIKKLNSSKESCTNSLTLFLMGFLTNRTLWGSGADLPPLVIRLSNDIFNIFFNRGLVFDVKGQKNHKRFKIRYLEIRRFIQKRPAKIKPRHPGCSVFFKRSVLAIHEKSMNINMC